VIVSIEPDSISFEMQCARRGGGTHLGHMDSPWEVKLPGGAEGSEGCFLSALRSPTPTLKPLGARGGGGGYVNSHLLITPFITSPLQQLASSSIRISNGGR